MGHVRNAGTTLIRNVTPKPFSGRAMPLTPSAPLGVEGADDVYFTVARHPFDTRRTPVDSVRTACATLLDMSEEQWADTEEPYVDGETVPCLMCGGPGITWDSPHADPLADLRAVLQRAYECGLGPPPELYFADPNIVFEVDDSGVTMRHLGITDLTADR